MKPVRLSDYEEGRPFNGDYDEALKQIQKCLGHIQVAHIVHKQRAVIAIEGWDAAGKGGIIQRLTAGWDPRGFEVWPIGAPNGIEKEQHFLQRFWAGLPTDGEISVFDRTWYGRVLVERVEGFASEAEWRRAYAEINAFERTQLAEGTTFIKLFVHVTQAVQDKRLRERLDHPWKRWKIGPDDFRNRARRADYLDAMHDMFDRADLPWIVIDGNDKKAARIAALTAIAEALEQGVDMTPPRPDEAVERLGKAIFG
ncbi:polyphosphate kinase 2 family protein [Sphingomonas quercus]|uniref:Polyphosphate kinase n=1 Tax=Sphingomonas quercus TaxID=2842451 RepID=A0ABS6BJQ2_9SPHN|nr:polyphosphate kinase [Sphingomonas quercus]